MVSSEPGAATSVERLVPLSQAERVGARTSRARGRFGGAALQGQPAQSGPRGVGAILDSGVDAVVRHLGPILLVSIGTALPLQLLNVLVLRSGFSTAERELLGFAQGSVLMVVLFFTSLFSAALIGRSALERRRVSTGEALRAVLDRPLWLPVLGGLVALLRVVEYLGLCLCVLPFFVLTWLFCLVPAVYVLERVNPFEALGRSVSLAGKAFPRFLGWFIVVFLAKFLLDGTAPFLSGPDQRTWLITHTGLPPLAYDLLVSMATALVLGFSAAIFAAVLTIYYLDIRVRVEGLDLSQGLSDLERRVQGEATAEASP